MSNDSGSLTKGAATSRCSSETRHGTRKRNYEITAHGGPATRGESNGFVYS